MTTSDSASTSSRTALVTGGTRGIGFGIARALASEGWRMALCGQRDPGAVAETLLSFAELRGISRRIFPQNTVTAPMPSRAVCRFALGAMKAIWEAGLRVPHDVAVVGAGDVAHGDLLRVPLTTVAWSKEELGRRAAALLLDQIGPLPHGPFQRVVIPPSLVVRESSGGPVTSRPLNAPGGSRRLRTVNKTHADH